VADDRFLCSDRSMVGCQMPYLPLSEKTDWIYTKMSEKMILVVTYLANHVAATGAV
jgi:hypothetical protein